MNGRMAIWVILAGLAICGTPSAATAANGPWLSRWGLSPWVYLPPSIYVHEQLPYFAVHPPVYYSHIVRRPYGLLPYPYLPPPAAEVTLQGPAIVGGRHVTGNGGATRALARRPSKPLTIINPYVVPPADPDVPPESTLPHQPQVSYPAAMAKQPK